MGIQINPIISPLYIKLPCGSDIIFKGADTPDKLKGLDSVDIFVGDECNEYTEDDIETIDQSIRGQMQENAMFLMHNPVPVLPGSLYWFQRMFREPKEPGRHERYYDENLGAHVSVMKTSYLDNAFCPDSTIKRLEGYKNTNPSLYKLWALGEYAEMKGVILKKWDVVDSVPETADYLGYGVDFGFSEDPAACLKVYGTKKEIWVQGIVYSTDLTNEELYDKIIGGGVGTMDRGVGDSAEPKTIEDLRRRGLRGLRGVKKRANYKAEIANILQGMTIHIIKGDIDLQREISTWSWDEDKTGKLLPRPRDGNDHYMDALVMFIHEYRGPRIITGGRL
jgi:phage terminase large subunit